SRARSCATVRVTFRGAGSLNHTIARPIAIPSTSADPDSGAPWVDMGCMLTRLERGGLTIGARLPRRPLPLLRGLPRRSLLRLLFALVVPGLGGARLARGLDGPREQLRQIDDLG